MKKNLFLILLCAASLLWGTSLIGQDLYDQTAGGNGDGMISNRFIDAGDTTITSADDFTVETGDTWYVTDITIRGFRNGTGADMTTVKVEVYADAGAKPGNFEIYSIEHTISPIPAPVGDTAIHIVLNNTLILTSGNYWLTISGVSPSTGGWHWSGVDGSYGFEAVADDSANYLGSITNGWTTLTNMGKTFTDLAFKIGGTRALSVDDNGGLEAISMYPNPATDLLTINNIDISQIKSISVYNLNGQLQSILPVGNQVSLGKLEAGTYLIEVNTESGIVRKKIMKI